MLCIPHKHCAEILFLSNAILISRWAPVAWVNCVVMGSMLCVLGASRSCTDSRASSLVPHLVNRHYCTPDLLNLT